MKSVDKGLIADAGPPFTSRPWPWRPQVGLPDALPRKAGADYAARSGRLRHQAGRGDTLLADYNGMGLGAAFSHTPLDLNNAASKIMLSDHLVANTPGTSSVGGFDMSPGRPRGQ